MDPSPTSTTVSSEAEEKIEEAIQSACDLFVDKGEGISAPGQVYAWVRTTAHRILSREEDQRLRELPIDPTHERLQEVAVCRCAGARAGSCSAGGVKLLLDANLSLEVGRRLKDAGHDAIHVADIGLLTATDPADEILCGRSRSARPLRHGHSTVKITCSG